MVTARPHPMENPSRKEILDIKDSLNKIYEKMKQNSSYCPSVQELDQYGKAIERFMGKYHKEIEQAKPHLKNALIDLIEIPIMHPNMQRLSIQTCLKASIDNIDKFCQA
ncbi:MAG: hypothetical protein WCG14_06700 [Chlamydiia bacterium]